MPEASKSTGLLRKVARRMHAVSFATRLTWCFLVCAAIYGTGLLASRFSGFAAEWFTLNTFTVVPAVATLVALVWHRRPTLEEAAHALDGRSGSKDLFLTVALIDRSAGEYQPLVARAAEERAARLQAGSVVPFKGARGTIQVLAATLAIVAVLGWMKQFDPFGKVQAATQIVNRRQNLQETKKETEKRALELRKDEKENPLSEETEKAIEDLKTALNKMKPKEKSGNFKELVGQQKVIDGKRFKISNEKLKGLLSQNLDAQQFGAIDREKLEKWTRELQEGSSKSLQEALDDIKKDLEELRKTDDPVKKAELEQKARKKMKELSTFASERAGSKPLAAALQRAMKQIEMAKMEGMDDKEALEAAEKSLDLSKLELKELAQSAKDMKALEEALKVIQQAKQLNDKEQLDGEQTEGAEAMEEYAELYAELIAQMGVAEGEGEGEGDGEGDGDGDGLGGQGIGRGGKAPEDDSVETGFKTEQSKSAVTAGKVLMSIKTQGLSDRGDAKKEYRSLIQKVKQGSTEAILQEQVPPGYHEGIKSYFNNLDDNDDSKSATADAEQADADEK